MEAKVSIVLPTYNGEEHIRKSIESIIAQTYSNWELIIVNDCSTDNTENIVLEYADVDSRIRVIKNTTNQKLPRSLNIGFSYATGEFLTWTSDDNAYHKDALEVMINVLNKNSRIDMVYANYNVVDMNGNIIKKKVQEEPSDLRYINTVGACFLYRKSIAEQVGKYDPDLFLAEDYEYWIRIFLAGSIMHISQRLYDYGWHDKSLTNTRKKEIAMQTYRAKEKHFDKLLEQCHSQKEKNLFYKEMLCLITNSKEKAKVRKTFYRMDYKFAFADSIACVINIYQMLMMFVLNKLKRIKRILLK